MEIARRSAGVFFRLVLGGLRLRGFGGDGARFSPAREQLRLARLRLREVRFLDVPVAADAFRYRGDLRGEVDVAGVEVVRQGDNITLDMPSAITFGFDSSSLNPAFHGTLDRLASTMNEYGQTIIEIAGHTDSVGTDSYNQTLSVQRAQAVANYLMARGVNRERIIVTGAGESRPVASNDTEAGRAENRRVEITIVPLRE